MRAFEVPVRKDVDTLTENNISYVPVRPFVEVSFKNQSKRTVTADGANPTWNQDLYFSVMFVNTLRRAKILVFFLLLIDKLENFRGPNESTFHINNTHSFEDSLHIHLFDEIIVDILEDERMRDTTIHQRIERNWLGSLRIPFSTLYFNHQVSQKPLFYQILIIYRRMTGIKTNLSQVEGTFQLYSPPFLLGYDRQTSSTSSDHSYLRNSTFLTLFIIVQPPLSPPDPIMVHKYRAPLHAKTDLV